MRHGYTMDQRVSMAVGELPFTSFAAEDKRDPQRPPLHRKPADFDGLMLNQNQNGNVIGHDGLNDLLPVVAVPEEAAEQFEML